MGSPHIPTAVQFEQLRENQEPVLQSSSPTISNHQMQVEFDIPLPGIVHVHVCAKPVTGPAKVTAVKVLPKDPKYSLIPNKYQNWIRWDSLESKVLKTYQVLYSSTRNGTYVRANIVDMISLGFMHVVDTPGGWYKVSAVDYWGRVGPESEPVNS